MISCVDLFCGVGGLTHGLVSGGIKVVAGVDCDSECRFPYEQNNKAKFIECDIQELRGQEIQKLFNSTRAYTLLAGCAPCQSFSTYSRKGRDSRVDTKWNLVAEFGRLVVEVQPDFVTMENVPQLLDHGVFSEFLSSLQGYHVWHSVIDCARFRIPQTRKRLVLLASKIGPIALRPSATDESTATVREAISHLPSLMAGEFDERDPLHSACKLSRMNLRRIRASKPGGTWRDWPDQLVAPCHRKKSGETYPSVYGRMEWDAPSPTITTQCFGYGNGRFGHPEQDRAITLREAAILQTFPQNYRFLKRGERAKYSVLGRLIGNAVPVRLGKVIGRAFINHAKRSAKSKARQTTRDKSST